MFSARVPAGGTVLENPGALAEVHTALLVRGTDGTAHRSLPANVSVFPKIGISKIFRETF
jgi:hypothetical protein